MNKIMTILGISVAFLGLYRLIVLWKKEKSIATVDLFLGILAFLLGVEAVDKLTINWLYHQLGVHYYNIFIAIIIDMMLLGIPLRDINNKIDKKRKLKDWLELFVCAVFFTWYIVFYHPYR